MPGASIAPTMRRSLLASIPLVDHRAAKQSHHAMQMLNLLRGHRIRVLIPHGDIGILARFDGAYPALEEQLRRGRRGVCTQGAVNIDALSGAERLRAEGTLESLPLGRRPESVACRERSHGVV